MDSKNCLKIYDGVFVEFSIQKYPLSINFTFQNGLNAVSEPDYNMTFLMKITLLNNFTTHC